MDEKQKETAHSLSQLSMIFATIAGMLIVAAGLFWSPITTNLDISQRADSICHPLISINSVQNTTNISITNYTYALCYSDITKPFFDSTNRSNDLAFFLISLAILCTVNSFYFWWSGYWKIKVEKYKEWPFGLIVILLDILGVIYCYMEFFYLK